MKVQSTLYPDFISKTVDILLISPEVIFVNAVTAGGSVNFFASGVNFSRNNAIYKINESTKYTLS